MICPIKSNSGFNSNLVTWSVIHLTTTKFKPLTFSVSAFALSSEQLLLLSLSFMLILKVIWPVCFGVGPSFGAHDQIFPFLSRSMIIAPRLMGGLFCSLQCNHSHWSELCRAHNHTLPSHLRLTQPGVMKLKLSCDRWSFSQYIMVSSFHLELMTKFFSVLTIVGLWICNLLIQLLLGLARAVTLESESRRNHTIFCCLIWDFPNLEDQVPAMFC
jgi:hypothetical protein